MIFQFLTDTHGHENHDAVFFLRNVKKRSITSVELFMARVLDKKYQVVSALQSSTSYRCRQLYKIKSIVRLEATCVRNLEVYCSLERW
jgi:hypothetical protein